MKFTYYPGCSAHATSRGYEESIAAVAGPLGIELLELDDWNCCGATAYMNVNETLSFCLTARNLALAKKEGRPVCTACSACFQNLAKANAYIGKYPELKDKVNSALAEANLSYDGSVPTKHLLEVVVHDVGLAELKSKVKKPLKDLRVAPYYGCQIVRPVSADKSPENPVIFEQLIEALGATPTPFGLKTWCCGGSLIGTQEQTALRLCRNLLRCAQNDKADCIAVVCPMCQVNLEAYQSRINKMYGTNFAIPVVYFTQLIGMALDMPAKKLGLKRVLVPLGKKMKASMEARA